MQITRMSEVLVDHVVGRSTELVGIEAAVLLDCLRRPPLHGVNVGPVVVCPHQCELDAARLGSRHEPILKGALQVRSATVPVPVEEKRVHTVRRGHRDLVCHDGGIRLVLITAQRDARLLMTIPAWLGALYQFPLGPPCSMPVLISGVDMIIGKVVGADSRAR